VLKQCCNRYGVERYSPESDQRNLSGPSGWEAHNVPGRLRHQASPPPSLFDSVVAAQRTAMRIRESIYT
jgi:hypothetical protein